METINKDNRAIAKGQIHVIGAGLAGSEAAWQIVRRGVPVILHEMRPAQSDPAHKTGDFAELVCSNSLRSASVENAVGLLKEEMRRLDSVIMRAADANRVPAGGALAVDREGFARTVTRLIKEQPLITVVEEEVTEPEKLAGIVIFASGPLTSPALSRAIQKLVQAEYLYFLMRRPLLWKVTRWIMMLFTGLPATIKARLRISIVLFTARRSTWPFMRR